MTRESLFGITVSNTFSVCHSGDEYIQSIVYTHQTSSSQGHATDVVFMLQFLAYFTSLVMDMVYICSLYNYRSFKWYAVMPKGSKPLHDLTVSWSQT